MFCNISFKRWRLFRRPAVFALWAVLEHQLGVQLSATPNPFPPKNLLGPGRPAGNISFKRWGLFRRPAVFALWAVLEHQLGVQLSATLNSFPHFPSRAGLQGAKTSRTAVQKCTDSSLQSRLKISALKSWV